MMNIFRVIVLEFLVPKFDFHRKIIFNRMKKSTSNRTQKMEEIFIGKKTYN